MQNIGITKKNFLRGVLPPSWQEQLKFFNSCRFYVEYVVCLFIYILWTVSMCCNQPFDLSQPITGSLAFPSWLGSLWSQGGALAGFIGHFSDLSFRHATTQTQVYFGVFGFFRKKFVKNKTLPRSNHFLKIQWKIHFLTFFNIVQNFSRKKFRIEIWTFSFQICFRNKFSTSGSGQTENTQIRVFAYFQFDHFPKSKIDSESRFEMRMSIFLF